MTMENIQNPIYMQPVQQNAPVQQEQGISTQSLPLQSPVSQPIQNNYMPRYAPMIQNGQVYPVAIPSAQPTPNYGATYPTPAAAGYLPYLPYNNCCPPQPKPGGVSSVNITINGVNPPTQPEPCPQYYPQPIPYYQPVNNVVSESKRIPEEPKKEDPPPPTPPPAEQKKPEEKKPKITVVELTNSYIKNLESDLNNQDKTTRMHAAAELVKRFKEDESRKNEPRLTNLLNQTLQDESKPIVYTAMQALENGYANGNQITMQRLQTITDAHDNFGNSDTARKILTTMSETSSNLVNSQLEQNAGLPDNKQELPAVNQTEQQIQQSTGA